ncbi:acyltransferase family protein [Butyrivibrio sp. YAB3001]|uniref:acyltransferase family protein n=1 Tax=Butyrivibrio sp. YAB3001 TaxID=1520812 RepID=UPI0008F664AA|nr:acyltransferase family protein [Butyrivibrio sp. YAB3001]SFC80084.1 Surface polysaccharide O-acyltransferase, integral membrane enzyme [Butyrivibrio sp. YAB3001]
MKRNDFFDLIRGIACILVIFCHFKIECWYGKYLTALARFAVPFFLLLSGYFANRGTVLENISYSKKRIKATLCLIFFGVVSSAISNTFCNLLENKHFYQWLLDALSFKTFILFLFFNRARFLSSVMYYLFMLLYVFCIFIALNKYKLLYKIRYIVPVLLLCNIVISSRFSEHFWMVANFLFTGIPFFLIGYYIREQRIKEIHCGWKCVPACAVIVGIIFTIVERTFWGDSFLYFGSVILSISLIVCGLVYNIKIPKFLVLFGTKCSVFIFLFHCPMGYLLEAIFKKYGLYCMLPLSIIVLLVSLSFSVIFAVFKETIFKKYVYKKLT